MCNNENCPYYGGRGDCGLKWYQSCPEEHNIDEEECEDED